MFFKKLRISCKQNQCQLFKKTLRNDKLGQLREGVQPSVYIPYQWVVCRVERHARGLLVAKNASSR